MTDTKKTEPTKAPDPKADSDKTPEADQIKQAAGAKTPTSTSDADKEKGEAALDKAATTDTGSISENERLSKEVKFGADGESLEFDGKVFRVEGEPQTADSESPNSDELGDEWDKLYAHIDKTKEDSVSKTLLLRQVAQFKDSVTGLRDRS